MQKSIKWMVGAAAIAALATGCEARRTSLTPPGGGGGGGGGRIEITAQGITATARTRLTETLAGVILAQDILGDTGPLDGLDLPFDSGDRGCASTDPNGCTEPTLEERASELAADLAETLFDEESVETAEANRVVYRLRADAVCSGSSVTTPSDRTGGPGEPDPGNGGGGGAAPPVEPPTDTSCEDALARSPIRVEVTAPREGELEADLLVGDMRRKVADLNLRSGRSELLVDLSQARDAFDALSAIVGGEALDRPNALEGAIALRVIRNSADSYTGELAITRAIRLQIDGERAITASLAAASPAWSVQVDGRGAVITQTLSLGALDAAFPAELAFGCSDETSGGGAVPIGPGDMPPPPPPPTDDCTPPSGTLRARLAGLSAGGTIDAGRGRVQLTGLGLGNGPAQLDLDGQTLVALDVNPSRGRAFDLELGEHADGMAMSVAPALELRLRLTMGALASSIDVPSWALDEDLGVSFDGASRPNLVALSGSDGPGRTTGPDEPPPPPEPESPAARIVAGVLRLSARHADDVTVPSGSCLYGDLDFGSGDAPSSGSGSGGDPVPPDGGGSSGSGSTGSGSSGTGSGSSTPGTTGDGHPFARLEARPCP